MILWQLPQGARFQGACYPAPIYSEFGGNGSDTEPLALEVGDFSKKLWQFHAGDLGLESLVTEKTEKIRDNTVTEGICRLPQSSTDSW